MIFIPWMETIWLPVAGRYLYYSTPQDTACILTGFNLVYGRTLPSDSTFDIQMSESSSPDTWTPFYFAPYRALSGYQDQGVSPVSQLPEPFRIRPFSRVQIVFNINRGSFPIGSQNRFTLVGVREVIT
jgi:hypothetical protein